MCKDHLMSKASVQNKENTLLHTLSNGNIRAKGGKWNYN